MESTIEIAAAPTCPWIEFTYKEEIRTGCVMKITHIADDDSLILCKTHKGFRSFKDSKMSGMVDVSTVIA